MGIATEDTRLEAEIASFLAQNWKGGTVVLGFSGGPDSTALLHGLRGRVPLLVAHVDHGWREESGREAEALRGQVEALGLPFKLKRLEGVVGEEAAREARLLWFRELGGEAVVLGHQRDDQAETVLKRVLEGSHELGAMRSVSAWRGMALWRPLLRVPKRVLLDWLAEKGIGWLDDPTNRDPKYLRSRMRVELIPQLFGKEVAENLCLLGERSAEMAAYLDKRVAEVPLHRGPMGVWVDLAPLEVVERRHLVRKLRGAMPRGELERVVRLEGLDRGRLFVVERVIRWRVEVGARQFEGGWEAFWRGGVSVPEPEGVYRVAVAEVLPRRVRERRRAAGVPQILRGICPVVWGAEGVLADPLVDKTESKTNRYINLKTEYF